MTAPTSSTPSIGLKDSDIVCGRGGLANKHPGNRLLRRICNENRGLYQASMNPDYKQCLIVSIFSAIQQNGGRFVTRTKDNGWKEISDKKAKEKTAQLLREGAELSTGTIATTKPIAQETKKQSIKNYSTNFFETSSIDQTPMKRRTSLISPETGVKATSTADTVISGDDEDDLANLLLQPIIEPDVLENRAADPPALVFEDSDIFDRIALEVAGMEHSYPYHGGFEDTNHGLTLSACSAI